MQVVEFYVKIRQTFLNISAKNKLKHGLFLISNACYASYVRHRHLKPGALMKRWLIVAYDRNAPEEMS